MASAREAVGDINALYFAVGLLAMVFWEYVITLDMEIEFFWHGAWSLSRTLFFLNRYIPLTVACLIFHVLCVGDASDSMCDNIPAAKIQSMCILTGLGLSTTEVMHAVRLWHMFTSATYVKWGIVCVSTVYNVAQWALIANYLSGGSETIHFYNGSAWIPALVVHAILYALTIVRAFVPRRRSADGRWLRNRVLREGTMIFTVTFASTMFTTTGALSPDPLISIPARFAPLTLSITSAAMSRLMFNIRSLSAFLGTDPEWILSNLEMSRIRWTKGTREGELWVEVENGSTCELNAPRKTMWLDPKTKIRIVTAPPGILGDEEDEAYLVETVEDMSPSTYSWP